VKPVRPRGAGTKGHPFGGSWTTAKLDVIAQYLSSYTTALKDKPSKDQPFRKGCIDAFAGTGYRDARQGDARQSSSQMLLLPDLAEQEPQEFLDGSARLALKTKPHFDGRVENLERNAQLQSEVEAGWVGVPWDGKFLVCDGPIEELNLIDPEYYQESMKSVLEASGFRLVLIGDRRLRRDRRL